ncbi:MAG: hypothetical protein RLZZ324_1258 [Candidatus Parcubacteria bacterium]|jgi:type II secretory pathway pseudopilin PulG
MRAFFSAVRASARRLFASFDLSPFPPFSLSRGFTIIEAITVVAMIVLVTTMTLPFLSDTNAKKDLDDFSAEGLDAAREAQSDVMSGESDLCFGVHFQGDRFTFFALAAGTCSTGTYATRDTSYDAVHVMTRVTITAVSLAPGGACTLPAGTGNCDLFFRDHKGAPSVLNAGVPAAMTGTGTVTFTDIGGNVKTFSINAAGMTDVN